MKKNTTVAREKMPGVEVFFWILFSTVMFLSLVGNIYIEYKMTPAERKEYQKVTVIW